MYRNYDLNAELPVDPAVRKGKLNNGITYYIRKNSKPEKRAQLILAVNAGSTQEDDNQQGLAHFCEHMAFNGTKTWKGNDMIKYFEKAGIHFGEEINAYTSFDETVYMIELLSDNKDVFNNGFQVLEDWAGGLLFDSVEVEKERGVIIEEWRLGQGAEERLNKQYWPILFKGSRYAERIPIGKKEVIESFRHNVLKQFYNDWYRPELMAVVAVGDFDVNEVEKIIKDRFSRITNRGSSRELKSFEVPNHKEMYIARATDKELPYCVVQMIYKHEVEKEKTVSDYRKNIVRNIYNNMMNSRLEELQKQSNPPYIRVGSGYGRLVRTKDCYNIYAFVNDNGVLRGLETIIRENERVKRYGFTKSELEREKKSVMSYIEKLYNERNKSESRGYAFEYVRNFLNGEPIPGIEYEYSLYKKYVETISLDEVNSLANKFTTDGENLVVLLMAPEKEGIKLPSDDEIKNLIKKVKEEKIEPYNDEVVNKPLLSVELKGGKVLSEKKLDKVGVVEWNLSNGATVIFKVTDYKNDEILFSASSYGGYSLYPVGEHMTESYAASVVSQNGIGEFNYIQLNKLLKDKVVSVSPYISEIKEGLRGSSSVKDMKTLFELIYLYFTSPREDNESFSSFIERERGSIENRLLDPNAAFSDTLTLVMSGYHPRKRPIRVEMLDEINQKRAIEIYKERFADAGDFRFYFVGNIDLVKFKEYVEKYIGSLPSRGNKENFADIGINPPVGELTKIVYRGKEPKSTVVMIMHGDFEWNRKNRMYVNALNNLVEIKLRESIREDKGGTYGVGGWTSVQRYPKSKYYTYIQFGCNPDRVEELSKAAVEVLENIKKNGASEEELKTVKEQLLKEREKNMKENSFWLNTISNNYDNGEDIMEVLEFDKFVKGLKGSDFKELASKYYDMRNFAKFVLMPEK